MVYASTLKLSYSRSCLQTIKRPGYPKDGLLPAKVMFDKTIKQYHQLVKIILYLLFEVSFVLVLLPDLSRGGLVGKHIASGKLGGLYMGETYRRSMNKF